MKQIAMILALCAAGFGAGCAGTSGASASYGSSASTGSGATDTRGNVNPNAPPQARPTGLPEQGLPFTFPSGG